MDMFGLPWMILLNLLLTVVAPALRECRVPTLIPVATFNVPSFAMAPTIAKDSYFVSVCLTSTAALRRGDVIVFRAGSEDQPILFVKRLIGLPGDQIELRNGFLSINGISATYSPTAQTFPEDETDVGPVVTERLPEGASYRILPGTGTEPVDTVGPYIVPNNEAFVLGDNRQNSIDSRFSRIGFVPLRQVLARAVLLVQLKLLPVQIGYRWLPVSP